MSSLIGFWDVLFRPVRRLASAAGFRSPVCGHWREPLVDGLCFDCAMKRIERRTWDRIDSALVDTLTAHPEWWPKVDSMSQPKESL